MSHADIKAALEAAGNPAAEDWYEADALAQSDYIHGDDIPILLNAPVWLAELLAENERLSAELERSREQYEGARS